MPQNEHLISRIDEIRTSTTKLIEQIAELETIAKPPVVQELVLARRHAEDTRMRLGAAGAYERELNPWANTFKKESK